MAYALSSQAPIYLPLPANWEEFSRDTRRLSFRHLACAGVREAFSLLMTKTSARGWNSKTLLTVAKEPGKKSWSVTVTKACRLTTSPMAPLAARRGCDLGLGVLIGTHVIDCDTLKTQFYLPIYRCGSDHVQAISATRPQHRRTGFSTGFLVTAAARRINKLKPKSLSRIKWKYQIVKRQFKLSSDDMWFAGALGMIAAVSRYANAPG